MKNYKGRRRCLLELISSAKQKDPDADTSALERQIDKWFTNSTASHRMRLPLWMRRNDSHGTQRTRI